MKKEDLPIVEERVVNLVFKGEDIQLFEEIKMKAKTANMRLNEYMKKNIERQLIMGIIQWVSWSGGTAL